MRSRSRDNRKPSRAEGADIVGPTFREQLVRARRGQGVFRANVLLRENYCRVTPVNESRHLKLSHIKPWRHATDIERLDGANGLLLSPHIDHLFESGTSRSRAAKSWFSFPRSETRCLMRGESMLVSELAISRGNRTPSWTTTARTYSNTRSLMARPPQDTRIQPKLFFVFCLHCFLLTALPLDA